MQFLWKSQLKKERGKFLPKEALVRKKGTRKERLVSATKEPRTSFGVMALWVLFLGTGVYLVLFSPYLALEEPKISGLEQIGREEFSFRVHELLAETSLKVLARNRYFLVRAKKMEEELRKEYPLIKTMRVETVFPNQLTIMVEERDSVLLWCSGERCLHILEDGTAVSLTEAYEREENRSRTVIVRDMSGQELMLGGQALEATLVSFPLSIRQLLEERFGITLEKEMTLASRFANELRVKTTGGWEIFFGTRVPLETSFQALGLLFQKEIPENRRGDLEYIDLRTENRVFYRYKNQEEASESIEEPTPQKQQKSDQEKKSSQKKN